MGRVRNYLDSGAFQYYNLPSAAIFMRLLLEFPRLIFSTD